MKKEKTKNPSVKRRFNIADVIVIVLVLACVLGAVWIFGGSGIFGSGEVVTLEYELWIRDVRNDIASHIKSGVEVIEATKHYNVGTVGDNFTVEPFTYEAYVNVLYDKNGNPVGDFDENGERVVVEKPGYVTVILPITAKATVEEDGYYVNGYKISVGSHMFIRTPDFAGQGYIISVNAEKAGE